MAEAEVRNDKKSHKRSAFEEAFDIYLAALQKKPNSKKLEFIHNVQASDQQDGVKGIETCMQKLQSECERQGLGTRTKSILQPVIRAIKTYSSIGDVFVSAHPMPAALIWGSFRVFIELASISLDLCEKLREQMDSLQFIIGRLTKCEISYPDYPGVQSAIGRSYVNILEFWYQATKWCRERALGGFRKALKAPATTVKIDKALKQLNDNADRLWKVCEDAERELTHEARRQQSHETFEAREHRRHDYEIKHVMLLRSLKDWLGGTHESSSQQYDHFKAKKHPGSCQWLLRHKQFTSWWYGRIHPSVLWVLGQPGAGKSVLCSAAIEEAKRSPSEMAAAFTFLRLARKAGSIQLLRDLSVQLLHQLFQRKWHDQHISDSLYAVLRTDGDVLANVKKMFEQMVKHLNPVYIFLDGLNEVEGEFEDALKFLMGMASSDTLRLWCSSQYTPDVNRLLEGQNQLLITASDTQDDIESYLSEDFISKIQKIVLGDTKGCFLWASNMIEALATAMSEDERQILILDRLPRSMDQYYAGLFERLVSRDTSGWNLVRIVLSIVTFAKRPLRVPELREAVAILRGNLGDNISTGALPLKKKIIDYCSPLIECIGSPAGTEDCQIQLSHSLVRDFLKKHANQSQDIISTLTPNLNIPRVDPYVSSQRIAESCLRYLMQRKYSHLRVKKICSTFDVSWVYGTEDDHLLQYAADFWSDHFEYVKPTENDRSLMLKFVRSLNLYAWIQVQSIYLNSVTQRALSYDCNRETKRILPTWFANTPTGRAVESGYSEFIGEWGHLLRQGVLWGANREIDRCFWGALGPTNYLSKAKELERYPSFMFAEKTGSKKRCNAHYAHTMSPDGRQMMLAVLEDARYVMPNLSIYHLKLPLHVLCGRERAPFLKDSGFEQLPFSYPQSDSLFKCSFAEVDHRPEDIGSSGSMTLRLERWDLDGNSGAFMEQKREISQIHIDSSEIHYSALNPHRFALVPETFSRSRPAAIAISSDLHHVRVGASLLSRISTDIYTDFRRLDIKTDKTIPYWEEIASRASVVALARRRAPRQESPYIDGGKILIIQDDTPDVEPVEGFDEDCDGSSEGNSLMDAEVQSLFSESSHGENQKQIEDIASCSEEEDFPIEKILDSFSDSSISEASAGDLSFSDDDHNGAYHQSRSDTSGEDYMLREDPLEYATESNRSCTICSKTFMVHYKCQVCTNYDICESCFDAGKWCLDTQHFLTKKMYWDQQDGDKVFYKDLALVQDLVVIDTSKGEPRELYRFSRKSHVLIFDSPPIFHPTASIVVWLLSRDKLLLGDFEENAESIHALPRLTTKMRRISASMKISPCGSFLHIISFEAPVTKRRSPNSPPNANRHRDSGFQISVHLMTYSLSVHNIHESLKLNLSVRFSLGPLTQSSVIRVPFAVTWQPKEAYIAVSDSELKIYKVSLLPHNSDDHSRTPLPRRRTTSLHGFEKDVDGSNRSAKPYVSVLLEPLLLPSSAKDRTVQYFPPLGPDDPNASLIIGSRSASSSAHLASTPPIAVYLPSKSFSTWTPLVAAQKAEISFLNKLVIPLGGKFEDLGPGEELDLVRYRTLEGDFQSSAGLEDYGSRGGRRKFEVRYVEDLEIVYGTEKMLMRRVNIDDGNAKEEEEANVEEPGGQRRFFKTSTGAGTAVLKAGAMDEHAKMLWFRGLGPAEVTEVTEGVGLRNAR